MTMRSARAALAAAAAVTLLAVAGCTADQDELQQWMDQQRREVRPSVEPLSAPKKFDPQSYVMSDGVDPFSTQKLSVAIKQETRQQSALLASELNRRKEPLENYPLDSMAMVGSLTKGKTPYALLKVENLLYQVKPGDHLGQNYGKITQITETDISLREIIQDVGGEWIERSSTLQLQEKGR